MGKEEVRSVVYASLKKTQREGVVDLLEFMEECGYFDAPASGANHSCCDGGLAEHSVHVLHMMEKFGLAAWGGERLNQVMDSVILCALLHDLGKCGDYGKTMYVPNLIKDGRPTKAEPEQKYKLSDAKPFKRNPELLPLDHGTRSVKLATLFIDLTEEEEFAIRYHDGLYELANAPIKNHETELYMLLHWSDLWSSRVLEGDKGEGEE